MGGRRERASGMRGLKGVPSETGAQAPQQGQAPVPAAAPAGGSGASESSRVGAPAAPRRSRLRAWLLFALALAAVLALFAFWQSCSVRLIASGGSVEGGSAYTLQPEAGPGAGEYRIGFHVSEQDAEGMSIVFYRVEDLEVYASDQSAEPAASAPGYVGIERVPLSSLPYDGAYGGYRLTWSIEPGTLGFASFVCATEYIDSLSSMMTNVVLVLIGALATLLLYCLSLFAFKRSEKYLYYFSIYIAATLVSALIRIGYARFSIVPGLPAGTTASFFACLQILSLFAMAQALLGVRIPGARPLSSTPVMLATSLAYYLLVNAAGAPASETIRDALLVLCATAFVEGWAKRARGAAALSVGYTLKLGLALVSMSIFLGLTPNWLGYILIEPLEFLDIEFLPVCLVIINYYFAGKFKEAEELAVELSRLNESLDRKVQERTADLVEQRDRQHAMMVNIFHDLRSPIFVLKGCIEVARAQPAGQGDRSAQGGPKAGGEAAPARMLDIALERVGFLSTLVEELFLLARLESGDYEMPFEPVDMGELVGRVAQAQEVAARSKGVELGFSADGGCVV